MPSEASHRKPTVLERFKQAKKARAARALIEQGELGCFRCGQECCDQCGACINSHCIGENVPVALRRT